MNIFINELSFCGQFTNDDEILECISIINSNIIKSQPLINGGLGVRRTRNLADRLLKGNLTIKEAFSKIFEEKDPMKNDRLKFFLNLMQGPFIDKKFIFDETFQNNKSICGQALAGTSLHACLSENNRFISSVISATQSEHYNVSSFNLTGKNDKIVKILNFYSDSCLNNIYRKYDPNPKHDIKKDKVVNQKLITKMDLNDQDAQKCLERGIEIDGNKKIYSFWDGRWYEFPRHISGCYHGYPIKDPGNKAVLNEIKKNFGDPPDENLRYIIFTPL